MTDSLVKVQSNDAELALQDHRGTIYMSLRSDVVVNDEVVSTITGIELDAESARQVVAWFKEREV